MVLQKLLSVRIGVCTRGVGVLQGSHAVFSSSLSEFSEPPKYRSILSVGLIKPGESSTSLGSGKIFEIAQS